MFAVVDVCECGHTESAVCNRLRLDGDEGGLVLLEDFQGGGGMGATRRSPTGRSREREGARVADRRSGPAACSGEGSENVSNTHPESGRMNSQIARAVSLWSERGGCSVSLTSSAAPGRIQGP